MEGMIAGLVLSLCGVNGSKLEEHEMCYVTPCSVSKVVYNDTGHRVGMLTVDRCTIEIVKPEEIVAKK